jgi:transposase
MKNYHNFIGIDIGKFSFFSFIHSQKDTKEYENNAQGINEFLEDHKDTLENSLCILETTGGYELELLYSLCHLKVDTHRANTRKVKNFIRSYGNSAKTDALDSKELARYGFERQKSLELFVPQAQNHLDLFALVQRRSDLKSILVAEKNRLQSPGISYVRSSCVEMIEVIKKQIEDIGNKIQDLINLDSQLKSKKEILETIPGIGKVVASELLILLPELGKLVRKKIASLAGLAPISNDSGIHQGYRRTGKGRGGIKPLLFMAAMAGRNSNSPLKAFYENLITRGKKKMVALTALMRKILIIANARIKEYLNQIEMETSN